MSEAFDPYYKWLGIRPQDQPPNYYRLLGIALFENDPDVIEAAADGRMTHLKTYQMGPRAELCQRLLNEVSAARNVLLNPQQKAAYDQWLQQAMVLPMPGPPAPPPVEAPPTPRAKPRTPSVAQSRRRRRKSRNIPVWPLLAVVAIGIALVLLFVTVVLLTQGSLSN